MRYLAVVGGALLLQAAFSLAIIAASQGGGSFVGLGAMLMAAVGVPLTALLNSLFVHAHNQDASRPYLGRVIVATMALPAAQLALLVLVGVLRL